MSQMPRLLKMNEWMCHIKNGVCLCRCDRLWPDCKLYEMHLLICQHTVHQHLVLSRWQIFCVPGWPGLLCAQVLSHPQSCKGTQVWPENRWQGHGREEFLPNFRSISQVMVLRNPVAWAQGVVQDATLKTWMISLPWC